VKYIAILVMVNWQFISFLLKTIIDTTLNCFVAHFIILFCFLYHIIHVCGLYDEINFYKFAIHLIKRKWSEHLER